MVRAYPDAPANLNTKVETAGLFQLPFADDLAIEADPDKVANERGTLLGAVIRCQHVVLPPLQTFDQGKRRAARAKTVGGPLAQIPDLVANHWEAQIVRKGDKNAPGFPGGNRHPLVIYDFEIDIGREHMQAGMKVAFAGHIAALPRAVFIKHLRFETTFQYAARFGGQGSRAAHDGG